MADWQAIGLVVGLGLAWTSVHCAGMCGPLIAGLRIGRLGTGADASPGAWMRVVGQLGAYQVGRAAVYAGLGAGAGWLGGLLVSSLQQGSLWFGCILAAAFFVAALVKLGHPVFLVRLLAWLGRTSSGNPALSLLRILPAGMASRPLLAAGALGVAMAFLPCGIVLWALGLAAAGADPLQGAAVMLAVVVMSTPALAASAAITSAPLMPLRWRGMVRAWSGRWLPPASLAFSGTWILVMAISRSGGMSCHHLSPG